MNSMKENFPWNPINTDDPNSYPKDNVSVLVTYIGYTDKKPHCDNIAYYLKSNKKWYWDLDDDEVKVDIIAWAELPKPYIPVPRETKNLESLAKAIYSWCILNDMWGDNCIYFNGKAWASWNHDWYGSKPTKINTELYEYENKNPKDFFEYANPDTLSMSFEGPLCHLLNYDSSEDAFRLVDEFREIFEKHGYYYELGHHWNLSCYPV